MNGTHGEHGYFWLHRLHSMTGVIFALAFLLCFLIPYSSIFAGPQAFNQTIQKLDSIPMIGWILAVFVAAPLIFHAAMGLMIVYGGQINAVSYGYYRNWMYALQRLAGIVLIPFLLYHVFRTHLSYAFSTKYLTANAMHAIISPSWAFVLYCAGVVCAAFYIGNGLATAVVGWGIAASRRARSAFVIAGWLITFCFAFWGIRIVTAL